MVCGGKTHRAFPIFSYSVQGRSTVAPIFSIGGLMCRLLVDSASPASHQRPLLVYAGALVVAAGLSLLLPGRQTETWRQLVC
jgi:hypothetical protein